uniref:Caudal type homeobox 1 n=2 Tax=Homininae TaxID=207598 RepID=A0A2I3T792_PANTR
MRGGPRGHHVCGLCAGQGFARVPRPSQASQPRPGPASLRNTSLLATSSPMPVKEEFLP